VHDVAGWHTELYIDVRELHEIADRVRALPAVTVDHLGLHAEGLPALLALVEAGVRVKATGFGRVDLDPAAAVAAIMDVDPTALMFGTDLPSTRARRPFSDQDIDLLVDVLDPSHVDAVLWRNAADLYLRRLRAA
jgi:predicted TIM-barrel fold metal-dependent hydrolase